MAEISEASPTIPSRTSIRLFIVNLLSSVCLTLVGLKRLSRKSSGEFAGFCFQRYCSGFAAMLAPRPAGRKGFVGESRQETVVRRQESGGPAKRRLTVTTARGYRRLFYCLLSTTESVFYPRRGG